MRNHCKYDMSNTRESFKKEKYIPKSSIQERSFIPSFVSIFTFKK